MDRTWTYLASKPLYFTYDSINHLMQQTDGCSENSVPKISLPCAPRVELWVHVQTPLLILTFSIMCGSNPCIEIAALIEKPLNSTYVLCEFWRPCWRTAAVRLPAVDPVADGGLAAKEGIRCQDPCRVHTGTSQPISLNAWCTAEACVSTSEISCLEYKTMGRLRFQIKSKIVFLFFLFPRKLEVIIYLSSNSSYLLKGNRRHGC